MKTHKPRRRRALLLAGAVALLAGGAVWLSFDRDISDARARLDGRSEVVASAFGDIEYAVQGQGPPVLVIHGTGGGFDQGLDMVGPLAAHGYRLIAPSRFGYLRSAMPADPSPEKQADAIAVLLDHLGEERVFVFGGSAGAMSAMQFAIHYPERCKGLILMVPATYAPGRPDSDSALENPVVRAAAFAALNSDFLFWSGLRLAPDAMTRALLATDPALVRAAPDEELGRIRAVRENILPVSRGTAGLLDDRRAGEVPPYQLDRIQCPVLTISARDDLFGTYAAAAYAADRVADGRMLAFDRGGHILVGHDREVWDTVDRFLTDVEDPSGPRLSSIKDGRSR